MSIWMTPEYCKIGCLGHCEGAGMGSDERGETRRGSRLLESIEVQAWPLRRPSSPCSPSCLRRASPARQSEENSTLISPRLAHRSGPIARVVVAKMRVIPHKMHRNPIRMISLDSPRSLRDCQVMLFVGQQPMKESRTATERWDGLRNPKPQNWDVFASGKQETALVGVMITWFRSRLR